MKTVVYTREETVSCDGYDEVQQEATHPLVYYTLYIRMNKYLCYVI